MSYRIYSAVLLSLSFAANAHEQTTRDKFTPILNLGGRYLHSQFDYPVARLANALETGQMSAYQQGNAFDYVDIGLQADWTDNITTLVKGSYHGEDLGNEFAFEQVWLKYNYEVNSTQTLTTRLGRQNIALGVQNLEHSHQWKFAVEPLVMRASVGDGWRDDGLDFSWQTKQGWSAGLGVYDGDGFPSVKSAGLNAINGHIGWQGERSSFSLSSAYFNVNGRATKQSTTTGHTHSQASCQQASTGQVCFDGSTSISVLEGQWLWPQYYTTVSGEAWLKQENGRLFSPTGDVDYQGTLTGGWLTVDTQLAFRFHTFMRVESLAGEHHLVGANSALIASEAGIANSGNQPYRLGLGASWTTSTGMKLTVEGHQEHINGLKNNLFVVRYQADLWSIVKASLLN